MLFPTNSRLIFLDLFFSMHLFHWKVEKGEKCYNQIKLVIEQCNVLPQFWAYFVKVNN